jgi:predicted phosphodiesterase
MTPEDAVQQQAGRAERLYAELRSARRLIGQLQAEIEEWQRKVNLVTSIREAKLAQPVWLRPPKRKEEARATPTLLLSDLHLDEVVRPAEVEWANAYNRAIAERRLQAVFQRGAMIAKEYLSGLTYDGAVIMLGGDIVSGNIHEELARTNEDQIMATVVHWVPLLAAGLGLWAEEFGRVHVAAVVGNHGRNTSKPIHKGTARDNFDWLIYCWLADRFRDDPRFTWQIPDGADVTVSIYNTRFLLTHGNAFKGGDGQVGPLGPVMRGHLRTQRRQIALQQPYDWLVMGHWHTYTHAQNVIVNGSLKGLDEYAYQGRLGVEPPQQAFWVTTPEHGVTFAAPVFALTKGERRLWR